MVRQVVLAVALWPFAVHVQSAEVLPLAAAFRENPEAAQEALRLTRAQWAQVQSALNALGFDAGPADGLFGPRTSEAIAAWRASCGQPPIGHLDARAAEELISWPGQATVPKEVFVALREAEASIARRGGTIPVILMMDFTAIAEAYAKAGDVQGITRTVSKVLSLARKESNDWTNHYNVIDRLVDIAKVQARAGDAQGVTATFSEALLIARNLRTISSGEAKDVESSALKLVLIAEAQMEAGDVQGATRSFSEALSGARGIEKGEKRDDVLAEIAEAQVRAGDLQSALSTARQMASRSTRAKVQAKAGEVQRALSTARSIHDDDYRGSGFVYRDSALATIALVQATRGDIQGALSTARSLRLRTSSVDALVAIASVQWKAGDVQGATRIFSEAVATLHDYHDDDDDLADALAKIAEVQARAGDVQGATRTFSEAVAAGWVYSFNFQEPLAIAEAQLKAGDIDGAVRTVTETLTIVQGLDKEWWVGKYRPRWLAGIAVVQAKTGDSEGALSTARSIQDDEDGGYGQRSRWDALVDIAEAQAKTGDSEGALSTARSIDSGYGQSRALVAIAAAQATRGNVQGALSTARSIDPVFSADAFVAIATALIPANPAPRSQ